MGQVQLAIGFKIGDSYVVNETGGVLGVYNFRLFCRRLHTNGRI